MFQKIALFPFDVSSVWHISSFTFTLSSKTTRAGEFLDLLGHGPNLKLNAVLTAPVAVSSSGITNSCF